MSKNFDFSKIPEGEEVVITGLSGHFPESHNVHHFRDNLYNKADMVTEDNRRWDPRHPEIPKRSGKVFNVGKFDAGFFGICELQVHHMDPMIRILSERVVEAIFDAGIHPSELEGTNTGVFVGACFAESEKTWFVDHVGENHLAITGCQRSMSPNRVSYFLKLKGPSFIVDTACSSSLFALEHAYKAITLGVCDKAIVAGTSLCLHPFVSLQFARLGVLSMDGSCKSFDNMGNGYARSEAIAVVLLEKAKDARRVYGTVVHAKTNCDGYINHGITYPSGAMQKILIEEFYEECKVDPSKLSFLEAHGTGTKVGDPEELIAMSEVLCKNRKSPLLIGSVKSNIGHSEPTSGLCSITKCIIGMEEGVIPPNMHYSKPREGVEALKDGRLKVVAEKMPFEDDRGLIGVNSFGFGGSNGHVLLRWNKKTKINGGRPNDGLPRLVVVSGRTQKAINAFFKDIVLDVEYIRLLHQIFSKNIDGHLYRGYVVLSKSGEVVRDSAYYNGNPRTIRINFGRFIKNWQSIARSLTDYPVYHKVLDNVHGILGTKNLDDLMGTALINLTLIETLKLLEIYPDSYQGDNIMISYSQNLLSLEEAILALPKTNNLSQTPNKDTINTETMSNFFKFIGDLYLMGHNPQLHKIYPNVQYPVSRGTPMISPSIRWEWRKDWFVTRYESDSFIKSGEKEFQIGKNLDNWQFLKGHVIDGRILVPATCYLQMVWETLAHINGVLISDMRVVFENVRFLRAAAMPKDNTTVDLTIMVQRGSGNFEIIESEQAIVKGTIRCDEQLDQIDFMLIKDNALDIKMNIKDIYKELRLRGYNYKGVFKGLKECNVAATQGLVKWDGNWINFIDGMLQIKILQVDTRLLYVPTRIKKITIDAKKHIKIAQDCGEDPHIPIYVDQQIGAIKCGAIEIQGLSASSISLRKPLGEPVLEKYQFIPNITNLTTQQSTRVNMQIILENQWSIKMKVVEILDENQRALAPHIQSALEDQPLIQPTIFLFTKNQELKFRGITVDDRKLTTETECNLVIASNIFDKPHLHQQYLGALKENGFIISRESKDLKISEVQQKTFTVLTAHRTGEETLLLCRKTTAIKKHMTVDVTDEKMQFKWVDQLKACVKNDGNTVVYAQGDAQSGVLGFVNCLRREPGGSNIKTFFIADQNSKPLDLEDSFYFDQLKKNMGVNVLKNGVWGTYRHLLLEEGPQVLSEHCYVNVTTRGDLTSLKWIEGPFSGDMELKPENTLVYAYYVALNFRDVMTASGRINVDVVTQDRIGQECVQGFEFAGRAADGRRVMGMVVHGAMSTLVCADNYLLWEIPDHWTMEDAATVMVVYGTVIYGLVDRADLKKGETILIHSGTGGIGQAAITYALHMGCKVYTTVGTPEKREFLKKKFPQLKDNHIGNSRDLSFESMVMRETNGLGVNVVLNSLAEEKLQASVRCLAKGGRFLEIGKFDLASDNPLYIQFLEKEASFHGIMLDQLITSTPCEKQTLLWKLYLGMLSGAIQPLSTNVFKYGEIEKAFRFMASGKHMGKVLVKIRDEEPDKVLVPEKLMFKGAPRYFCRDFEVFIIVGGLGGFGLELADWLVLRGARNLVLTSRTGLKTGYQAYRMRIWKSYGVTIKISTANITSIEGCEQLIKEAQNLGVVVSIFNLAVVLKDAIFENQDVEAFKLSFGCKAMATMNLDDVTRRLCPQLRDFVCFSSVSCGRGNPGQTNYGMANSVMERICEKRKSEGFPGLAIQWGAVGGVGLVAEMQEDNFEMEIGGTLQQKISSCLNVMDQFLRQNSAVVSSMVVAEKRSGAGGADNVVDAVANILGIRDLMSISLHSTLAELGMDSMTAVEIKQTLEREYDVFLTAQDIRSMTFARLQEIQAERETESGEQNKERALMGMDMLIRLMGYEDQMSLKFVEYGKEGAPKVIIFPGVEGVATVLSPLVRNLRAHSIILQYSYENPPDSLMEMVETLKETVLQHITKEEPFNIIGYSFGAVLALEIIAILESQGYSGSFIALDGAPAQLREFRSMLDMESDHLFETSMVLHLMALHVPYEIVAKHREDIFKCNTFEDKIRKAQTFATDEQPYTPEHQLKFAVAVYKRIKGFLKYEPSYKSIKAPTSLFKPKQNSMQSLKEDYKLEETLGHPVKVQVFEGNHVTILENQDMANAINKIIHRTPPTVEKPPLIEIDTLPMIPKETRS